MKPSLTDTLCTRCGLCCDGSLFADVELAGRTEATRLAIMGLEVEDDDADGEVLVQPCAALRGRRCGIYAHRPKCCQTFECRLLRNVRRGAVSVEQAGACVAEALNLVRRAKALLVQLGPRDLHLPLAERSAEALAREMRASRKWNHERAELEAAMSALGRLIRMKFLGGERAGRTTKRY
jgi:hypothetical protein